MDERKAEIDEIIARVRSLCERIRDEGLAAAREAEAEAGRNVSAHAGAVRELEGVDRRLAELRAELEGLPLAFARASLSDDYEAEVSLKERHAELEGEIADLEARRSGLGQRISELVGPNARGHRRDVDIFQYQEPVRVAGDAKSELQRLRQGVAAAVSEAVEPIGRVHAHLLGEKSSWQNERAHDRASRSGWDSSSR